MLLELEREIGDRGIYAAADGPEAALPGFWDRFRAAIQHDEERYFTVVNKTPNTTCWIGSLYNFNTGSYEGKLSSCGTTKTGFGNTGWTMWESCISPVVPPCQP